MLKTILLQLKMKNLFQSVWEYPAARPGLLVSALMILEYPLMVLSVLLLLIISILKGIPFIPFKIQIRP